MCGRFAQFSELDDILAFYKSVADDDTDKLFQQNYNVAPTQKALAILGKKRIASIIRWGLITDWNLNNRKFEIINARDDSLISKNTFQKNLKTKRCLIPVNGFYEWNKKQPFYITSKSNKILSLAGIYEELKLEDEIITSFSIITTQPSKNISKIHNRMPVIIDKTNINRWLDSNEQIKSLQTFFKSTNDLHMYRVNQKVNSPLFNNELCIKEEGLF